MTDNIIVRINGQGIGIYTDVHIDDTSINTEDKGIFVGCEKYSHFRQLDTTHKFWNGHVEYNVKDTDHSITYLRQCSESIAAGRVFDDELLVTKPKSVVPILENSVDISNVRCNLQFPLFHSRCSDFKYEGIIVSVIDIEGVFNLNTDRHGDYPATKPRVKDIVAVHPLNANIPEPNTIIYLYVLMLRDDIYAGTRKLKICSSSDRYKAEDYSYMWIYNH